jgi:hypothetical protein
MNNLQIELKIVSSYHHHTHGQTECHIRTIRHCSHNFPNPRGTKWENQLHLVQLASNTAPGDSTGSSLFKIIFGQNVCPLPAVRIYSTNVFSTMNMPGDCCKFSMRPTKH